MSKGVKRPDTTRSIHRCHLASYRRRKSVIVDHARVLWCLANERQTA